MASRYLIAAAVLLSMPLLRGAARSPELEAEIRKIDTAAADPDGKVIVMSAMADRLQVHRNRLILLRKETGFGYGEIFVSELEKAGRPDILQQTRSLNQEIEKRRRQSRQQGDTEAPAIAPVLQFSTGVDHSSLGTFYSVVPKVGIESRHASLTAIFPVYKIATPTDSVSGMGDILITGLLTGHGGPLELGAGLTAGVPTGDQMQGLGAGKATFDGFGTLAWRAGIARFFADGGIANSIFNNVAYQRPYISTGTAGHLEGGLELQVNRYLALGGGGFLVRPTGNQTVYSRVVAGPKSAPPVTEMPRSGTGIPPGKGKGNGSPGQGGPPVFQSTPQAQVAGTDLRDDGPQAWATISLARPVWFNIAVARSLPFHLTTVHAGITLDLGRLIRH